MKIFPYPHGLIALLVAFFPMGLRGAVVGWGDNSSGQITIPAGLDDVVAISAGGSHSLALKSDGQIVGWGNNDFGQTNPPPELTDVMAIASGTFHNLALRANGQVVAWGANFSGQTDVPSGLSNVVAVACGAFHSLALRADGQVVAWGEDFEGQIQVPPGLSNVVAIAGGGGHSLALRAGGQVIAWGENSAGQTSVPAGLTNVIAIAAGDSHSLALKSHGEVVGWGNTIVPPSLSSIIAVAAGDHSLALDSGGNVFAWQADGSEQEGLPVNLADGVAIAAGQAHSLALTGRAFRIALPVLVGPQDMLGTVNRPFHYQPVARNGVNSFAANGLPPGLYINGMTGLISGEPTQQGIYPVIIFTSNSEGTSAKTVTLHINLPIPAIRNPEIEIVDLASLAYLPILADNEVDWYGENGLPVGLSLDSETGLISGTPPLRGEYAVTLMASNQFGIGTREIRLRVTEVVGWGRDNFGQHLVPPGVSNVVSVAGGFGHSLALQADGRVAAWGWNYYGQADAPPDLEEVVAIAAGDNHSLALRGNGQVVAWGGNWYGQIDVPPGLEFVLAIAGGLDHSLALQSNGRVAAWGWNDYLQTDVPADLTNVVAIAAGAVHSLALRTNGQVVAWGGNDDGQIDVPSALSNAVAIAAGDYHNLALQLNGQVVGWGGNDHGQIDVPSDLTNVVAIAARGDQSLALTSSRQIVAWGGNNYGQTNVPEGLTHAVAISGGRFHQLAVVPSPQLIYSNHSVHLWNPATLVAPHPEGGAAILQWYLEGAMVAGGTNRQLVLSSIQPDQSGRYTAVSQFEFGLQTNAVIDIQLIVATVQGRHIFYNHSAWDGNEAEANAADDAAIAPDKSALLPGQKASFANYTSYSKGINGIMIDVADLAGAPIPADFTFRVGNDDNPSTWSLLATNPEVSVRPGAGVNGSDRVTLIWAGETIAKQWLEVTVLAAPNTGLASPEVFYFGNAIGEAGDSPTNARVDLLDRQLPRANPRTALNPAPIDFPYDYNRDKRVDLLDRQFPRIHPTTSLNALRLIDLRNLAGFNDLASNSARLSEPRFEVADNRNLLYNAGPPAPEWEEKPEIAPVSGKRLRIWRADFNLVVEWAGLPAQRVRLEICDDMDRQSWSPLEAQPEWAEANSCWRWRLPISAVKAHQFFRIMESPSSEILIP